MKLVTASHEIMDDIDGLAILKKIEKIARLCYKSEDKITDTSCFGMVRGIIKRGHEAMLEHVSITVRFVTDRGVTHEEVRHRISSYAQESTRYCNYADGKFGGEITAVAPAFWAIDPSGDTQDYERKATSMTIYKETLAVIERAYNNLIALGDPPQEARIVLPTGLKTEIVHTANLREWRHILNLRAVGTTGAPHPQIEEIMAPLLQEFSERIPVVFDDLWDAYIAAHNSAEKPV